MNFKGFWVSCYILSFPLLSGRQILMTFCPFRITNVNNAHPSLHIAHWLRAQNFNFTAPLLSPNDGPACPVTCISMDIVFLNLLESCDQIVRKLQKNYPMMQQSNVNIFLENISHFSNIYCVILYHLVSLSQIPQIQIIV